MVTTQRHRPRSPMEVEDDLDRITEALADASEDYRELIQRAAEAEADYRSMSARATVALADTGTRMTAGERDARAMLMCLDEHRQFLLADARAKGCREFCQALRTQIAALQTLAANRRQLG